MDVLQQTDIGRALRGLGAPKRHTSAGAFSLEQLVQKSRELVTGRKAHIGIVRLVGEAGGRGRLLSVVGHVGCHHLPASTTPAREQTLVAHQTLPERIGVVELAAGKVDHRGVADAARLQRAEVGALDRLCRAHGAELDDLGEVDAEVAAAMGGANEINFQATGDGKAAITGDFLVTGNEVNPLIRALRAGDIEVTAIHSHMLDEQPRMFFIHFWANDDALKLARGVRAALDKTAVAQR